MICREIVAGELVCYDEAPRAEDPCYACKYGQATCGYHARNPQRATYSAGESREVFNLVPRDPFGPSRSDYRREFPFHLIDHKSE